MRISKALLVFGIFISFQELSHGDSPKTAAYVEGEVVVKFKDSPQNQSNLATVHGKIAPGMQITDTFDSLNMYHIKTDKRARYTTEQLIDILTNNPDVEIVEPNYIITANDFYPNTIKVQNLSEDDLFYKDKVMNTIKIPESWDEISYDTAQTTVVAVIDTGVQTDHDSLREFLWINDKEIENGIDDDSNGYVDDIYGWNFVNNNNDLYDYSGHGTGVIGVVKQTFSDLLGNDISDSKANISIMPIKFMTYSLEYNKPAGDLAGALRAINYANKNGAKVINASWGDRNRSRLLKNAIIHSYKNNVAFVTSAGNSRHGNNNDEHPYFPPSFSIPNIISVGASTIDDILVESSNYGENSVHIAAPGHDIWTATSDKHDGSFYTKSSGTSISAPFVSGTVAMLINLRPDLPIHQVKEVLLDTSDRAYTLKGKIQDSRRLNVLNSVLNINGVAKDSQIPQTYVYELSSVSEPERFSGCWLVSSNITDKDENVDKNVGVFLSLLVLILPFALCTGLRMWLSFDNQNKFPKSLI